MTFKLTIKADTLAELSHKLLVLGGRIAAPTPGAATTDTAPVIQSITVEDAVVPDVIEEKKTEPKAKKAKAEPAKVYDYATEVAPLVLKLVEKRGRTVAADLLATFDGAKKATEVDASRYPELVEALNLAAQ